MATNGFLITVPRAFHHLKSFIFIPFFYQSHLKTMKSRLLGSCSASISFPSVFSLNKKETILRVSVIAAQQEENNPVLLEEERGEEEEVLQGIVNWDLSENEAVGEESDGVVDAVGDAGDDDGYAEEEPPEEAKVFVGNLPYDDDSEKLAQIFDQGGVVEISEVIYNRETNQSRGFGFVTMSTVEEAEKAVEMFHRYAWELKMIEDFITESFVH